jgi:hypothetical protein
LLGSTAAAAAACNRLLLLLLLLLLLVLLNACGAMSSVQAHAAAAAVVEAVFVDNRQKRGKVHSCQRSESDSTVTVGDINAVRSSAETTCIAA